MSLLLLDSSKPAPPIRPWEPAPRSWSGNMCGIYIPGAPKVSGGSPRTNDLILSWFYDRYPADWRAIIRAEWHKRRFTEVLVSWPDSRSVGATPQDFVAMCDELYQDNFNPCPMLYSKDYDPTTFLGIQQNIAPVLPLLQGHVNRICVGWELSIALSPTTVQQLIDWIYPQVIPWGCKLYVHFQEGYFAFQQPGGVTADFWNPNVGKLHGILHQRVQDGPDEWDKPMYQARIVDCLERFAGRAGFVPDSGFGCPWEFICLEITAEAAYNEQMSEAEQNSWAQDGVSTPPVEGPLGLVSVVGSGNGIATPGPRASYAIGGHPMLSGATLPEHPHH